MTTGETIIALASGGGRSARAIVRLSGADTPAALRKLLVDAPAEPGGHVATLRIGTRFGGAEFACRVIRSLAPRSYTGEDAAEVQIPGNPALARRVIDGLADTGLVRLARPGEFTARAFLAGKLTLAQAEGVRALIAARTDAELRAADLLLRGETGDALRRLADDLASALALVEAGIDFTDQEDVVAIGPRELEGRLASMVERIDALAGPGGAREADRSEVRIVLAGAPSAGKSTLFNALLGGERAIVDEAPGTTRDVIAERIELPGVGGEMAVALVDLAGLDGALAGRSALDAGAQRAAREAIECADVIVACDPAGRFDLDLPGKPTLRVRTKADLVGAGAGAGASLGVCALDGWNLGPLRRALADAVLALGPGAGGAGDVIPRHGVALRRARGELSEARRRLEVDLEARHLSEPEVIAGSMRAALDELGGVVGEVSPDDVIGRIFASFCVGK